MDREGRIQGEQNRERSQLPVMLTLTTDDAVYSMKPSDNIVIAISSAADAAAIITLPSVVEACGRGLYYISAPTAATAGDISVYTKESGAELTTYGDLDADDDHLWLFSDGTQWRVMAEAVA